MESSPQARPVRSRENQPSSWTILLVFPKTSGSFFLIHRSLAPGQMASSPTCPVRFRISSGPKCLTISPASADARLSHHRTALRSGRFSSSRRDDPRAGHYILDCGRKGLRIDLRRHLRLPRGRCLEEIFPRTGGGQLSIKTVQGGLERCRPDIRRENVFYQNILPSSGPPGHMEKQNMSG